MKKRNHTSLFIIMICLLASTGLTLPSSAFAAPAKQVNSTDRTGLGGYVDQYLDEQISERSIPGLVIAIVENDEVILLKGYGYSDLASQTVADPEQDLFRIGSLTKTFTFTALMQLIEQGRIDLDANVNEYLGTFTIPEAYDRPMRIRDILSHRTGFEDVWRDRALASEDYFKPFEEWLVLSMPEQVFSPGEVTGYSNYGPTLAGYFIQELSGLAYEEYIQQNILTPLGMDSTTAKQPLTSGHPQAMSKELRDRLATVYQIDTEGKFNEYHEELIVAAPAGAISTTAQDMSRYMRAHLGGGALDSARILQSTTVDAMRERIYDDRNSPDFAHGFVNGELSGYETYGHDGATFVAYSSLLLIPELNIGIFIGTNGGNNIFGPSEMSHEIGRYLIGERAQPSPETLSISRDELDRYAGSYLTNLRSYTGFFKILGAILATAEVAVTEDNNLHVSDQYGEGTYAPLNYTEFVNIDTGGLITFGLDNGTPFRFFSEDGLAMHSRLTPSTNIVFLLVGIILALILSVTQLTSVIRQRLMQQPENQMKRRLWILRAAAAAVVLLSILLLVFAFVRFAGLGNVALSVQPTSVTVFFASVYLVIAITVLIVVGLVPLFRSGNYTMLGKVHYLLFAVALLNFLIQLNNWNMVGFNYW